MNSNSITTIDFHGASLVVQAGDSPANTFVAMKPIVLGMGIAWEPQLRKIKSNPVLTEGMTIMIIPSSGGPQTMTALPLNRLNLWLATINANKVPNPDTRARIIQYQTEAADALFAHFFGKTSFAAPVELEIEPPTAPEPDWDEWGRWISLIDVARRVHGRAGAKQLWQVSPLPQISCAGVTFQPSDGAEEAQAAVHAFLDEATERRPGSRIAAVTLFNAFTHWARVNGQPLLTKVTFGRAIGALGVQRQRSDGMFYLDLALPAAGSGGYRNIRPVG